MIITISGEHGSGKSSMAKRLAGRFGLKHYSTGDIFRKLAKKRKLTLVEYLKLGENDPKIDGEVDEYVKELGRKEDNFVIDSRLAWHFIPGSVKIYLKVEEEEGAQRTLQDKRGGYRKNEYSNVGSVRDLMEKSRARKEADRKRYQKYYGITNIDDESNYDLFLDTTDLNRTEVAEKLVDFVKSADSR